jgi:putative membrane protein
MLSVSDLPSVNAALNATSAVLLTLGYAFIRQRAITAHTMCMLAAFGTSTLFLVSYLTYHYFHGTTPFGGTGWVRPLYFAILISHTALAVTIVPLAIVTLYRALKGQFKRHEQIARVTLPLWLYVSITGVVVYWMLYHLYSSR